MTTFATAGKKIDDRIEDFRRKVHEAVEGMHESLKSADRQGFERAIRLAVLVANARQRGPEEIAEAIRKIPYSAPE